MPSKAEILRNYEDPSHPTAFSAPGAVARFYNIDWKRARSILQELDTYVMHKEYKKPKAYNPYYIFKKRKLLQTDLIFITALADDNDGIKYLCTIIDVFTRYLWVYPLTGHKDEHMVPMWDNFLEFDVGQKPEKITSDLGLEFHSNAVLGVFANHGVEWEESYHTNKAAYAERVNKTLQILIYKYILASGSRRYIGVLDDIVASYNARGHRGLEYMTPNEAEEPANQARVLAIARRRIEKVKKKKPDPDLQVGDVVRLKVDGKSRAFDASKRAYGEQYHQKYYKIHRISTDHPIPMYYLKDWNTGEVIDGGMYREWLSKMSKAREFKIDHVVKWKGSGRYRKALVKWENFGDEFNTWEPRWKVRNLLKKKNARK